MESYERFQYLRHVEQEKLSDEIVDVLVELSSPFRVLGVGDELVRSMARCWKVYRAFTNLETVHLKLHSSAKAVDVLSSIRAKLVLLTLHPPMPTENRIFSVLSGCASLEQVEFQVGMMVPGALHRKFFENLKSLRTITCVAWISDANPNKDTIDVIACNLKTLNVSPDRRTNR